MTRPKAHHYIPAAHLAAFSQDAGPIRHRKVWVADKRTGSVRLARIDKVAFENDLYTIRTPELQGGESTYEDLLAAVFDPANKAADVESHKARLEDRGIRALRELATWPVGSRILTEEEREPVLSYTGLLLAQHPTVMAARAAEVERRLSGWATSVGLASTHAQEMNAEFARSESVFAMISETFAVAYELNYLGWKIVRWPAEQRLVVGDNAATIFIPTDPLGIGDVWTEGARCAVVVSSSVVVFMMRDLPPGACFVEERVGGDARREMDAVNWVSWARARRELCGPSREVLEELLANPAAEHLRGYDASQQLAIRTSMLIDVISDEKGLPTIKRPNVSGPENAAREWALRFG